MLVCFSVAVCGRVGMEVVFNVDDCDSVCPVTSIRNADWETVCIDVVFSTADSDRPL